jgi:sporulation protein YlmC with PRC-barrel domain
VSTSGGTKVGQIRDIVLDEKGRVTGFSVTHISATGPVAKEEAVACTALADTGAEGGIVTVDLGQAERETVLIDPNLLFPAPVVAEGVEEPHAALQEGSDA